MIYEFHVESLPGHQYHTSHTSNASEHFLFVFMYSSKAWRLCQPNFNAFNKGLFELYFVYTDLVVKILFEMIDEETFFGATID